ncbi:MAG: DUF4097 family beta strand repeat-containing protein [Thermoanaerobaculia bacterium]
MKTLLTTVLVATLAVPALAGTLQKEINASPGETLTVDLRPGGSIEVRAWDKNSVSVEATVSGETGNIKVDRSDGGVAVSHRTGSGRNSQFKIQVPRRFDLDLETNGGSITIENVDGTMKGASRGGALRLSGLRGTLKLSTHGGDITLRDSKVDGSVSTMGGNVLLENVDGTVKASSMGGNVSSRNTSTGAGGQSAVELSTMGGNVIVEHAPNGATVSTMGGNVVVKNAGRAVRAKTMGGNVALTAIDGSLVASTMGGNVTASIVATSPGSHDVTIESKGGDVEVVLPAGFAMNVEVEIAVTKPSARRYGIESDFPLDVTTTPAAQADDSNARRLIRGHGQSGAGTHKVRIKTMNGDVKLKRG